MKSDAIGNAAIGIGGTVLALITPEKAAIIAGLSTAAWMIWQLVTSVYDRFTNKPK
jgi:hypothetical protein